MKRILLLLSLSWLILIINGLNAQVVEDWYSTYDKDTGGTFEGVKKLLIDVNGDIIVGGVTYGPISGRDISIIKYTEEGDTLWITNYTGQGNFSNNIRDMAMDKAGNIYIVGENYRGGTAPDSCDMIILKYDTNGMLQWEKRYNGTADNWDIATSVVTDYLDNIYVTGVSITDTDSQVVVTIKYNSTGDSIWVRKYNPNNMGQKDVRNIIVDNSQSLYITFSDENPTGVDTLQVLKYDSSGNLIWVTKKASPSSIPSKITIDSNENIYVTGVNYLGNPSHTEILTMKMNSETGDIIWEAKYEHPASGNGSPSDIKVDSTGNVYVCGDSKGVGTGYDYITLKYNSLGNLIFSARYSGADSTAELGSERATAIEVDQIENIYVTGFIKDSLSYYDMTTIKYNKFGDSLWVKKWVSHIIPTSDWASTIAYHNGNLYIGGYLKRVANTDRKMLTVKYKQMPEIPAHLIGVLTSATSIKLTWVDNSIIEDYFELWKKDNIDTNWVKVDSLPSNTVEWSDTGLVVERKYIYRVRAGNSVGFSEWSNEAAIIITNVENQSLLPEEYMLYQNYPNPFNPTTTIKYAIPFTSNVKMIIYNILGETISEIINDVKEAGYYNVDWNSGNAASGIYFYSINTKSLDGINGFNSVKKMILVK